MNLEKLYNTSFTLDQIIILIDLMNTIEEFTELECGLWENIYKVYQQTGDKRFL